MERISTSALTVDYHVPRHGMRSVKSYAVSAVGRRFWDHKRILTDVSFQVRQGECFGVVGRNGSGKSTLLRALAGILDPTSGEVRVTGRLAPMLSLGAGLEPELTGVENIELVATLLGGDRAAVRRTLEHVRGFSGLSDDDLDMPVKRYSSGMSARLGFSIATAEDPDVLLIDEALAVGDEAFQAKCHARIAALKKAGGCVVLVSHSLAEVQRLCDRAACLEQGRIVAIGHPHEVGQHYHRLLGIA